MKKTLVALAVLGSFAGVASAATSVTLYGNVDVGYEDWTGKRAFDLGKTTTVPDTVLNKVNRNIEQGGLSENNSTFGIKGQEDLGNGVAAIFKLEGNADASNGIAGTDGRFFHRETTVGLKGAFGEVKIGRAKSQMELALGGIVPGSRVADVDLYSVAKSRHSNGLFYTYDNAGVTFGADVTTKGGAEADENGTTEKQIAYGVRLGWSGNLGGVTLVTRAAYQNDGGAKNSTAKNAREVGGLVAAVFDPVTVGVAYAQGRGTASDLVSAKFGLAGIDAEKAKTLSTVVAANISANDSVYAKWQKRWATDGEAQDLYRGWVGALGYSHSLSKRTSVNLDAAYAKISVRQGLDLSAKPGAVVGYSLGLNHAF